MVSSADNRFSLDVGQISKSRRDLFKVLSTFEALVDITKIIGAFSSYVSN